MIKKALVLSSGGLDSTTCLGMAVEDAESVVSLSFDYGQRHRVELVAADRVAHHYGVEHRVIALDLRQIGGSALTSHVAVPKGRSVESMGAGIPVTYVPARNTILLSYALAVAEVVGADVIYTGVNALDYSGYPDCRPAFIEAFTRLANLATARGVTGNPIEIRAPLIQMTKAEIIRAGTNLGVPYGLTHSCYDPSPEGLACGECDSCILRKAGFEKAGVPDPTGYAVRV